jgi:cytochrome c oxidase subunit III
MQPETAAQVARLAHHFPSLHTQQEAARLGMWLFLATEVLLFTALFTAYSAYRYLFGHAFEEASRLMHTSLGAANTLVLLTSSLTAALAVYHARRGGSRRSVLLLAATLAFAATFMVIKAFEYSHHFHEGQLPGKYYSYAELQAPGASMFFTLYFLMTGVHGLHVLIGMGVLGFLMVRSLRGAYSPAYNTPVELGVLYWHLVDLIWIFLFPLLYLI